MHTLIEFSLQPSSKFESTLSFFFFQSALYVLYFFRSQTSPSKLTLKRIEIETLRGAHSKVPGQNHHTNPSGFLCVLSLFYGSC